MYSCHSLYFSSLTKLTMNLYYKKYMDTNTAQNQPQNLDKYIEDLIDQKNYPDITQEVRDELKKDITLRLNDFIMARVIAAFSDDDVLEFEKLLKANAPQEELQQFTATHIPEFETFLTSVLLEFRDVYLGRGPLVTN